jgi:GT2 family glycosyltransferase
MNFSLVILSYNHPEITSRCVSSALKFLPSEKIILAHNGSDRNHIENLKNQFPTLTHWEFFPNRGYSGGVNAALNKAFEGFEWVFLLTNDTQIEKWNFDVQSLSPGLYSPMVWMKNKKSIDYTGGFFDARRAHLVHLKNFEIEMKTAQYPYIPGTAFLVSRDVFEKLGPLDESLHTYWEDVDFGARASKEKISFGLLKGIEIIHYGRKTTRKDPLYSRYLFRRNRMKVSWRYCPWYYKPELAFRLVPDAIRVFTSRISL